MEYAVEVKQENFELVKLLLNYIIKSCKVITRNADEPITMIFEVKDESKESWAAYKQYMDSTKLVTFLSLTNCKVGDISSEKRQTNLGKMVKESGVDMRHMINKWNGTEEENDNE